MLIKIIISALLLFIVFNLIRAGIVMLRQPEQGHPLSYYLGRRVLISAVVLVVILLAMAAGLITPNPRPY